MIRKLSIRRRVALWCGLLCYLILLVSGILTYALHVRSHYDEFDRVLVTNANHTAAEMIIFTGPDQLSINGGGGMEVTFRLYNANGVLQQTLPEKVNENIPATDPRRVIATGPAFDLIAGLAPPMGELPPVSADGVFGQLDAPDQRWRVYVLPLHQGANTFGYLETLMPLGHLDTAIQAFRLIVILLGLLGLVAALFGGWLIAGRALRPVTQMVEAAQKIAFSRDFSHRIQVPPQQDELGHLALTFNQMLASLEEAYRTQQRFISDASHELRAPLTAIQGNLELLRRQRQMPEAERMEALDEATREAIRMGRLVADLLALARADAGLSVKHYPVELDVLVLEAFQEAHHLNHNGQELSLEQFEPVRVEGDADQLKQLILILLDNALKYTPAKGQITLNLQISKEAEDQAELVVRDTGIGITEEDLPHVFERFYRADPARRRDSGGTGLGLSIAQWIVEQHKGRIELTSKPGKGTTVRVRLPLHWQRQ